MKNSHKRDGAAEELKRFLATLPPGTVTELEELVRLLKACWERFAGGEDEAMAEYKLDRMENARWCGQTLTFEVERHGGVVMGSTRAERQQWTLDMDALTATPVVVGFRQVRPSQPRLDVHRLAEELFQQIHLGNNDPRLKWYDDGSVRVRIGDVLPAGSAVKKTIEDRRRRFWAQLDELIDKNGWAKVWRAVYKPL